MNWTTKQNSIGAVAMFTWLAMMQPATAETCREHAPVNLLGAGNTYLVARPDGQEMCFTIPKSAGLAAGRITVLTVRPFQSASADEVDVQVTKERTLLRGTGVHQSADFSMPGMAGSARVFILGDEDRHVTLRVRPRHGKDYRLAIIAHEIDIPQMLGHATLDAFAHIAMATMMEEIIGKNAPAMRFLDERIQSIVLKTFFGAAKGHSKEQIVADIGIALALKQAMAGQDVPRDVRIAVATFLVHAWRELSKSALKPIEWPLPAHARDTSKPIAAALR